MVTILVLVFGFAALASPNLIFRHAVSDATQKFAAGWIGLVIGYWLS